MTLKFNFEQSNELQKLGSCGISANLLSVSIHKFIENSINQYFKDESFSGTTHNPSTISQITQMYDNLENCIHQNFGNKYDYKLSECKDFAQNGHLISYENCLGELSGHIKNDINADYPEL